MEFTDRNHPNSELQREKTLCNWGKLLTFVISDLDLVLWRKAHLTLYVVTWSTVNMKILITVTLVAFLWFIRGLSSLINHVFFFFIASFLPSFAQLNKNVAWCAAVTWGGSFYFYPLMSPGPPLLLPPSHSLLHFSAVRVRKRYEVCSWTCAFSRCAQFWPDEWGFLTWIHMDVWSKWL